MTPLMELRCCLCAESFQPLDRRVSYEEHSFHFECSFDFSLDREGASLQCNHLVDRVEVVPPEDLEALQDAEDEVEEGAPERGPLSCVVVCAALGLTVFMMKFLVDIGSNSGPTS